MRFVPLSLTFHLSLQASCPLSAKPAGLTIGGLTKKPDDSLFSLCGLAHLQLLHVLPQSIDIGAAISLDPNVLSFVPFPHADIAISLVFSDLWVV